MIIVRGGLRSLSHSSITAFSSFQIKSSVKAVQNQKSYLSATRMSTENNNYLDVAIKAARAAGSVISEALALPKNIHHKGAVDLVTETDKECERLILDMIKSNFPTHLFIGEESASENEAPVELTNAPTWMCDPIDGTNNFVHQYPSCCVSLGLWINSEPLVGVVYNPVLDELFTAQKGKGAFKNGEKIQTSQTSVLSQAVFATEVGTDRDPQVVQSICNRISKLAYQTRSIRCGGSIALDLCHVACGRLDFCYEIGFGGCWDIAAAALIVQEAGGKVFDPIGTPFHVLSRRIFATNAHLDQEVINITSKFEFYKDEPRPIQH